MELSTSKFLLGGLILTICGVIFQLIGLASPYWLTYEAGGFKINIGLWKFCGEEPLSGVSQCVDTFDNIKEDWFNAVRAMSILGLIALLVALVMVILKLFVMKDNKVPQFTAIGTAFAAAVFLLISVAVFAAKMNDLLQSTPFTYHFAFAFCIIAMLAAIGAGCLLLVNAMK